MRRVDKDESVAVLSVETLSQALNAGALRSEALLTQCFARIHDARGEGARTFIRLFEEQAMAAARAVDRVRQNLNLNLDLNPQALKHGGGLSPYAGIPISVKDLFDLRGSVTTAGSRVLHGSAPAAQDALAVQRLRQAGFIVVGATNMTEFAYSGLGINPHYGTPLNPFERQLGRIPGGSSSGAAVAISDGFAAASLGTDTGGSCRIPAALCGLVGFKPTASRIPRAGVYPLSPSLDAVGTMGASVTTCAILDAVLSGSAYQDIQWSPPPRPLSGLRLAVPQQWVLNEMDAEVSRVFDRALEHLRGVGAQVTDLELPELERLPRINSKGGFVAAEAYAQHREALMGYANQYDPRVRSRILQGELQTDADYHELLMARSDLMARVTLKAQSYDALLMPTVPVVAPLLSVLEDERIYHETNLLMLRNPSIANFLDRCAISLPCHSEGEVPVGLMLMGTQGGDADLLSIARCVEQGLAGDRWGG